MNSQQDVSKQRAKRILAGFGITVTGVALCVVGGSAISEARNPLKNTMDRIAGRYNGTLTQVQGQETAQLKGALEIVRTGDVYQLVGGFAGETRDSMVSFNQQISYAQGKFFFEHQPATLEGVSSFIEHKSNEFAIRSKAGDECLLMHIRRDANILTMKLSTGPDWNRLTTKGSIEAQEVRI